MKLTHAQAREAVDLNGFWRFRIDPEKVGERQGWIEAPKHDWDTLYVPGNWNEQRAEYQWHMGTAWYARTFHVPADWCGRLMRIHFEAVLYRSKVWVNGQYLGEYEGGYLPFDFRVEEIIDFDSENEVVVCVDNVLTEETIPATTPGRPTGDRFGQNLDFFHYGGIHRDVSVEATARTYIEDTTIVTAIQGSDGEVAVTTIVRNENHSECTGTVDYTIRYRGDVVATHSASIEIPVGEDATVSERITVPDARLWDTDSPNLYTLTTVVKTDEGTIDATDERFGIRTVEVQGNRIVLNGKPIFLKGVSGHEDFPVLGKAVNGAVLRRDFDLMKKLNVNFFRTTHYPYTRAHLDLADELGFLVVDELVWLKADYANPAIKRKMKRMLREMIARDKNHPSIFMYTITNEPTPSNEGFRPFLKELLAESKAADPTRVATYVGDMFELGGDRNFDLVDVICHNAYYGWYGGYGQCCGDPNKAAGKLSTFLDNLHAAYPDKPIILTEFGADAIAGFHSDPPEMWTEDYQAELIEKSLEVVLSKPYMAGASVWNLCDYRTPQGERRTMLNRKGLFTRTREPKLAAKTVQRIYEGIDDPKD